MGDTLTRSSGALGSLICSAPRDAQLAPESSTDVTNLPGWTQKSPQTVPVAKKPASNPISTASVTVVEKTVLVQVEESDVDRGPDTTKEDSQSSGQTNGHISPPPIAVKQRELSAPSKRPLELNGDTAARDLDRPLQTRVLAQHQVEAVSSPAVSSGRKPLVSRADLRLAAVERQTTPIQAASAPSPQPEQRRLSIPVRIDIDVGALATEPPPDNTSRDSSPNLTPSRRVLFPTESPSSFSKRRRQNRNSLVYALPVNPRSIGPDPALFTPAERKRETSPELSPQERAVRVVKGQEIAQAQRDQFRIRISALSEKYGVRPTELAEIVRSLPRASGGGSQYWQGVEQGLRDHFGR